jgi:molecular chaperone DnaJ
VVELELEDVLTDQQREISFEAVSVCERCRGNGAEPGTPIETCPKCEGTGQLQQVSRSIFGQVVRAMTCDRCGGDGRIPETPCERCGGAGRVAEERTWEVDIPAGIEDGQRLRIAGAGHAAAAAGRQGDLYVEVRIDPDEDFTRQGTELIVRAEVPVTTAIVGGEVFVPTLDGEVAIDVPAGTQHGDIGRLKGRGLPPLHGGRRGDQHVVFELAVPTDLDPEQREAAERLAEALGPRHASRRR